MVYTGIYRFNTNEEKKWPASRSSGCRSFGEIITEKPLQYFSDDYLERCRELSPDQIVTFLDQFRSIAYAGKKTKSKLISLKVPLDLLEAFKFKAQLESRPYQTLIKELMVDWLQKSKKS